MSKYGIRPEKEAALHARMEACSISEGDLEERFVHAGGPGGQHVNKTATCVQLKHVPTGTEIKMQKARSQNLNRYYARKRLCEIMEEVTLGRQSPESLRREKIRKQKSRRKRRGRKAGGESS